MPLLVRYLCRVRHRLLRSKITTVYFSSVVVRSRRFNSSKPSNNTTATTTSTTTTQPTGTSAQQLASQIVPFAVLNRTHSAIRWQMDLLEDGLINNITTVTEKDLLEFEHNWQLLNRCIDLHSKQENEVFFPVLLNLLDKLDKESTKLHFINDKSIKSSFFTQHNNDDRARMAVTKAFHTHEKVTISKALKPWIEDHRKHLQDEEDIMMPLTILTGDTVEERGAIVREMINVDRDEFTNFQFGFVLKQLVHRRRRWLSQNSGQSIEMKKNALGSIKMYCLGTRLSSNKEEYSLIRAIIKDVLDPNDYELFEHEIERDGAQ